MFNKKYNKLKSMMMSIQDNLVTISRKIEDIKLTDLENRVKKLEKHHNPDVEIEQTTDNTTVTFEVTVEIKELLGTNESLGAYVARHVKDYIENYKEEKGE